MSTEPSAAATPIVCDMTDAPDTAEEWTAEWGRLLAVAYTGRERIHGGVRLRLRADDGIEAWVRDLAARDKACWPSLDFTVTTVHGEVRWEVTVADGTVMDDDMARTIMDEFYNLPDTIGGGGAGMVGRLGDQGLAVSGTHRGPSWRNSTPLAPERVRRDGLHGSHLDTVAAAAREGAGLWLAGDGLAPGMGIAEGEDESRTQPPTHRGMHRLPTIPP